MTLVNNPAQFHRLADQIAKGAVDLFGGNDGSVAIIPFPSLMIFPCNLTSPAWAAPMATASTMARTNAAVFITHLFFIRSSSFFFGQRFVYAILVDLAGDAVKAGKNKG